MDKVAMIKVAEVNGVLAALAEADLVKIASEEDFGKIAEQIAESLPDQYDMEVVLAKTAEVMEEVYAEYDKQASEAAAAGATTEATTTTSTDTETKTAEDVTVQDCLDAQVELAMKKQAGEISEEDFAKESALVKEALEKMTAKTAEQKPVETKPSALDKIKALKKC